MKSGKEQANKKKREQGKENGEKKRKKKPRKELNGKYH